MKMYVVGQHVWERPAEGSASRRATIEHIFSDGDIQTNTGMVYNDIGMSNDDSYRSIRSLSYEHATAESTR